MNFIPAPSDTTTKPEARRLKLGRHARLLLLLAGVAGLLVLGITYAADRGASVVVRDSDGGIISRSPLPGSGDFQIEYVHSYYNVLATEHFTGNEGGSFELVEISSPSEAVLDYYELEGRKEIEGDRLHLVPDEPQEFLALPLIGTEIGGRTLVVSGERYPLYGEGGARHIVIKVERDGFVGMRRMVDGLRPKGRLAPKSSGS